MPNFKIFQDNADQARVKIFGNQNVALNTSSAGDVVVTAPAEGLAVTGPANGLIVTATAAGLAVTGPANGLIVTAPAAGLAVTGPANGLIVTAPAEGLAVTGPANGLIVTATAAGLAVTGPLNGLIVTATAAGLAVTGPLNGLIVTATAAGLAVTGPANGLIVTAPAAGLAITPPAGGLLITSTGLAVETTVATTDVTHTVANFADTAGAPDAYFDVMEWTTYSFGIVNASTTIAPATVKLQISPDAANWIDHAGPVTLNTGDVTALVSSIFLKYARVYYAAVNAASAVTLNIFFQGQT